MSDAIVATPRRARQSLGGLWIAPPALILALLFFYPLALIAREAFTDEAGAWTMAQALQVLQSRFFLNALLNTASGATWVSFHHGGGVGMGYSQHAGVVIVCDGTPAAARRIERVLWNDPASGVMRHADAGYPLAIACAREHKLSLPMLGGADGVR